MKVALIGLGKMGVEIAGNILRAGHELRVYNRTAAKTQELERQGARVAITPREAAAQTEVVLTVVLDDAALEEVTFGDDGILAGLGEGAVHASLSTCSVEIARRIAEAHRGRGREFVAAPVFGRPEVARQAKLVIVAGGPALAIARLQPILDVIGRMTFNAGSEPWRAVLFKLCGNFMITSMGESFAEAQALIRKAGSEPADFVAVMAEFWESPVYRSYGTLIATGHFDPPGGTLAVGLKDNRLLLEAAREFFVPLPLGSLIRDHMLAGMAAGNAELDWSSFSDIAMRNAGLTPARS